MNRGSAIRTGKSGTRKSAVGPVPSSRRSWRREGNEESFTKQCGLGWLAPSRICFLGWTNRGRGMEQFIECSYC